MTKDIKLWLALNFIALCIIVAFSISNSNKINEVKSIIDIYDIDKTEYCN